jgi:hypothetical protein
LVKGLCRSCHAPSAGSYWQPAATTFSSFSVLYLAYSLKHVTINHTLPPEIPVVMSSMSTAATTTFYIGAAFSFGVVGYKLIISPYLYNDGGLLSAYTVYRKPMQNFLKHVKKVAKNDGWAGYPPKRNLKLPDDVVKGPYEAADISFLNLDVNLLLTICELGCFLLLMFFVFFFFKRGLILKPPFFTLTFFYYYATIRYGFLVSSSIFYFTCYFCFLFGFIFKIFTVFNFDY